MLNREEGSGSAVDARKEAIFLALGARLSALDLWTRVDFSGVNADAALDAAAIGYRGLPMRYRVAGVTLGDADAAPFCPAILVQIESHRVSAQALWSGTAVRLSQIADDDATQLHRWTAGSLSKDLRILQFDDGAHGLEADMHLADALDQAALHEFVSAFSWDVAALHAAATDGELLPTEEWVVRSALSISRSTPRIPLRVAEAPEWPSIESPAGVFCSLQPGGGICESDNVLYAVRRASRLLEPLATLPGSRNEWDYTRFLDVWLARDGLSCIARTILGDGYINSVSGSWRAMDTQALTAITPFGADGFVLGLHDGEVLTVDAQQRVSEVLKLGAAEGRFAKLASVGDRIVGLVGSVLLSASIDDANNAVAATASRWSTNLDAELSFEYRGDLDVDTFSQAPCVAVLGDRGLVIVDAETGAPTAVFEAEGSHLARWIGPGLLLVVESVETGEDTRSRVRLLDVHAACWTSPVETREISRLAVRGSEIHVGYADLTVAVWDRMSVCGRISAVTLTQPRFDAGLDSALVAIVCDVSAQQPDSLKG
jgi:hypothetical protein